MRKVILQEFVSIDGRAAGPNDSVDFVPASNKGDSSFGQRQSAFLDSIDVILLGRVTYTMFAAHWPNVTEAEEKPFADKLNAIPKIVFSKTLSQAPWGEWKPATIVRDSPLAEIDRLKKQHGKDMVIWGSLSLAQSLMNGNAIDEYQLIVCPIVLGTGKPLFRDGSVQTQMKLVQTRSFDRGTVLLCYTRV